MEVKLAGEIDSETGYLIGLTTLKKKHQEADGRPFRPQKLNLDTAEIKNLNPAAEKICYAIWKILRSHLDEKYDLSVRLYKTPRNFVEDST